MVTKKRIGGDDLTELLLNRGVCSASHDECMALHVFAIGQRKDPCIFCVADCLDLTSDDA